MSVLYWMQGVTQRQRMRKKLRYLMTLSQSLTARTVVLHVPSLLSWKTGMRSRMKPP